MKPAGGQKKPQTNKNKKNVLLSQKMQLRKRNILPQDAVDPLCVCVCVCGDAVSVPTCVSLQRENSPSHKLLVTEGIFGRKYHPVFPLLSWYPPRLLL